MFRGALEPWHILILVLIVVILFGWKKLPDAARSLGRSARILKSELGDDDHKSSASGQTVPGQTQPPAGAAPGEAPVPGANGYPQQQTQQQPPAQGYQQQPEQPQQPQQQAQQTPASYPQQGNTSSNGN